MRFYSQYRYFAFLSLALLLSSSACFVFADDPQAASAEPASEDDSADDAAEADNEENEYLGYLIESKADAEARLEAAIEDKYPERLLDSFRTDIKRTQTQIEIAREMIASGEGYDREDYLKWIEATLQENAEDLRRSLNTSQERLEESIRETNDRFRRVTADAEMRYRKRTAAAEAKYLRAASAKKLKSQFTANPGKIGLIIWNLPQEDELHPRQTSTVGIRLIRGDTVVWQAKSYRLDAKQVATPVQLPNVLFDKVQVDLLSWRGEGGGLAEIEVMVGDDNVAARRPCEVTNLETLPMHLDDRHALTDGITQPTSMGHGYWIPEAGRKASVQIDLLGNLVKEDSAGRRR